jgi:hypothetical protein
MLSAEVTFDLRDMFTRRLTFGRHGQADRGPDRLALRSAGTIALAGFAGFLLAGSYRRDRERIGGVGSRQANPHPR